MQIGRCPSCARPFSAGEVTGIGILRSRSERLGGPLVEFACPRCGTQIRLVPHGNGRYAIPGQPPPPAVPAGDRAPPWVKGEPRRRAGREAGTGAPEPDPPEPERYEIPYPPPRTPPREAPPPTTAEEPPEEVASVEEAREILGIGPQAPREEVERAFRRRSRTCHPDKVAHLDPEFMALAERKFRRLKSAFDLLSS